MKRCRFIPVLTWILFLAFLMTACRDKEKETGQSENSIDAARNFIRAALDGKFDKARTYLLPDSVNLNYMEVAERAYLRADQATRDGYRSSSINIHEVSDPVRDSVTIVVYSNSFKNDHDTLKVLKTNGQWLVDLKYLYEHSEDTSLNNLIRKDTIQK